MTHPLFSFLGLFASWNRKLSRYRYNFLPANWGVMSITAIMVVLFFGWSRMALENHAAPIALTAAQFSAPETGFGSRPFTVTGELHPEKLVPISNGAPSYPRFDLIPMVDSKSRRGFFVRTPPGTYSANSDPSTVTVTGMRTQLGPRVLAAMTPASGRIGDAMNPQATLDPGVLLSTIETPENPVIALGGLLCSSLVLALFLGAVALRNTVFQVAGQRGILEPSSLQNRTSSTDSSAAMEVENMRVTGRLRLSEKYAERFVDVPAELVKLGDGQTAIASNIDASTRFYGAVTKAKVGTWLLIPRLNGLQWSEGVLYNGFKGRPALQLAYASELDNGKAAVAVLSFASEAGRAAFLSSLGVPQSSAA